MVTRSHRGDTVSNLFDDSRGLVSVHGWQRAAPRALHVMDIAVTNGTGGELDLEFAGPRCIDHDLFDDQRLPKLVADSRLHGE